jgi:hypothetical protein
MPTLEGGIRVNINGSLPTLSPLKLMCAEIVAIRLINVLLRFDIRLSFFVPADRQALWPVFDPHKSDISSEMLRPLDAVKTGDRPGSVPLDAVLSVRNKRWERSARSFSSHPWTPNPARCVRHSLHPTLSAQQHPVLSLRLSCQTLMKLLLI